MGCIARGFLGYWSETPAVKWKSKSVGSVETELQQGYCTVVR